MIKKNELLDFCKEKNILLEEGFYNLFLEKDFDKIKKLIIGISEIIKKKFINKNLILQNKEEIEKFIDSLFQEDSYNLKKEIMSENNNMKETISFSIKDKNEKIEVNNFVNLYRNRYEKILKIMQEEKKISNLSSIGKILNSNQKCSVVGMIFSKNITKNGNIILEVEDMTGRIKIISSQYNKKIFDECENLSLDSVLGFVGSVKGEVMFLERIIFPELILEERKKTNLDESAVFIGDLHFGSIDFMEENFRFFIEYLNSNNEESNKIKYLFIVGDLISGVGVYPNQFEALKIKKIEEQFFELYKMLNKIRKDIKIIIIPGNHDGVRLMEPQPKISYKYAHSILDMENVYPLENPGNITIGKTKDNDGINVLCYHGFSFPYYHNNIPSLLFEKSINDPIKIMKYLFRNRHLSPSYGSVQQYPHDEDFLLIENAPDIFVSGHTHKSGISYENNILFISVSSWEKLTPYQKKLGNKPDFCKVPMLNLKTRAVKILDFEHTENEK